MIRPLSDRIVIEALPGTGMVGIIHMPNTKNAKNQTFHYASVLAAGPKVELAKAGTKVFCSEFFGDEIECEGRKVRVGRERDIVGVI